MDSLLDVTSSSSLNLNLSALSIKKGNTQADLLVLDATFKSTDQVQVGFSDLYKSLSLSAQEIVDKLNDILKGDLPNGLQSLKPEEVTPEATAEKIVNGATAFFEVFKKQNPNLEGEDLLNAFMETVRKGINAGYNDAFKTLEDLGAFKFDGIQAGVEQTKELIEEKLKAYEAFQRKNLGLDTEPLPTLQKSVQKDILTQAGSGLLNVTA